MDYRYEHLRVLDLQLIAVKKVCLNKEYSIRSMYQLDCINYFIRLNWTNTAYTLTIHNDNTLQHRDKCPTNKTKAIDIQYIC